MPPVPVARGTFPLSSTYRRRGRHCPVHFLTPPTENANARFLYFDYNLADELTGYQQRNHASQGNQQLDKQSWGLDHGGNWLSHSQASGNVMQTRQHNLMNQLEQIGGQGSVVVEGTVNEFAEVTVNNVQAALFEDPLLYPPAYRYRAIVPVTQGTNTLTVTATDQDEDATTNQWEITVPASQRTFTYDANGNLLTDSSGRAFVWDAKNRLKRVTVGGKHYEWDYDYRDRRVREYEWNVGGNKNSVPNKQFIWHGNEIVQERTGTSATAGTIARNHYYGGFTIGATVSTAEKYQTFTDHLGNVREVVASSGTSPAIGTLITRYDYSPYQGPSKIYQHPGTNIEATFQTIGRYYHHEPSGLELALYRAYDPELGRWISEDPIGESDGPNLYALVRNAPTGALDLFGLAKIPYPGRPGLFYYTSTADLNVPKDKPVGVPGEQCVGLVKSMAGVPGDSKNSWIQGPTIESLLKKPDGDPERGVLKPGVAIATFKKDGQLTEDGGKFDGHAALFGGMTEDNKCNIYDQYMGRAGQKNPGMRAVPYSGGAYPGHGNNWNEFSIILTK